MRVRKHDHIIEERPWGKFETVHNEEGFQIKRIEIKPGARLSLQKHAQRAEYWTIVRGQGVVTLGEKEIRVKPGSTVHVPVEGVHRIQNTDKEPLVFVEVQMGDYLGEDDIVRLHDDYNRQ